MNPKISVILAAYNEEKLLPRCLKSLQAQTFPKDQFEIILVDNNSTDKTAEIGNEFGVRVYPYTKIQGAGAARKYGITYAKGEIIAVTDPDSVVTPDWLEQINKLFDNPKIVCIGGPGRSDTKDILADIIYAFVDNFWRLNRMFGKPLVWGFNMAFRKKAYDEVGGFNEELLSSEDWDLSFRLNNRFGKNSFLFDYQLKAYTSSRKLNKMNYLGKYTVDALRNYFDFVIFGKKKAVPTFTVR